jgi:peptidoglycan/LPS O-acetylase OafA/YrhL
MAGSEHKLEALQAARAIAALTVAYFHSYVALRAFPETTQHPIPFVKEWGFLGVNFFFAISGYVICLMTAKPSFSVRGFAIKRFFRLYPVYWIVMAFFGAMMLKGYFIADSIGHFLYSMTLLPQKGAPFYELSWTLEREMVFYALAALIVPIGGFASLAVVLALLAAAGLHFANPWLFHIVSTIQAGFLAGVIVYLARPLLKFIGAALPIVGGCALLWYTRTHDFPFSADLCMAMILAGMLNLRLPWKRQPFRLMVSLGDASYSIYLLHYLVFFWGTLVADRMHLPGWMCEPWRFFCIGVASGISYGTWRLIEKPLIGLGNALADTGGRAKAASSVPPGFATALTPSHSQPASSQIVEIAPQR